MDEYNEYIFRRIIKPESNNELLALLDEFHLILPEGTDDNLGIYQNEELIGCGFRKGNMLQGLALRPELQGEGLSAKLITRLIQSAVAQGINHLNVITKPSAARQLKGLGFRQVASADPYAVMLEFGQGSIQEYTHKLQNFSKDKPDKSAAIVMNGNPFTLGHRHLLKQASDNSPWVWVLVVQEDVSAFPFSLRFQMAQEAAKEFPNVSVIPGGEYVISSLTFPAYFLARSNIAPAQGTLDAEIFGQYIAPALKIQTYYFGTEPMSQTTNLYHDALKRVLPGYGVNIVEVQRLYNNKEPVSASRVRKMLKENDWDGAAALLPQSTKRILKENLTDTILSRC